MGGATAARLLAEAGRSVLLVEESLIGGECLNYGCVPFKTLYRAAEILHSLSLYGAGSRPPLGYADARARAGSIVGRLRSLLTEELEGLGVDIVQGRGVLRGGHEVYVAGRGCVGYGKLVVATGSEPVVPRGVSIDEEVVVTNRGFLSMDELPGSMVVVGGGAIGIEAASIAAYFGSRVVVVEAMREILPFMDRLVARRLRLLLRRRGVRFILGRRVASAARSGAGAARVTLDDGTVLEADAALIAIGRRPRTRGLGLEEAGVELDERGFVRVDERCRTSNPDVYAVGDVTGPPMLAHKAIAEAEAAALDILGGSGGPTPRRPRPEQVPVVVYSIPPAASIGLTEDEARRRYGGASRIIIPFGRSSRAWIEGWGEEGVLKLVVAGGVLVGVHVLGPAAGELVAAAAPLLGRRPEPYTYPHMSTLELLHDALLEALKGG